LKRRCAAVGRIKYSRRRNERRMDGAFSLRRLTDANGRRLCALIVRARSSSFERSVSSFREMNLLTSIPTIQKSFSMFSIQTRCEPPDGERDDEDNRDSAEWQVGWIAPAPLRPVERFDANSDKVRDDHVFRFAQKRGVEKCGSLGDSALSFAVSFRVRRGQLVS
jgi:hypothetical protein